MTIGELARSVRDKLTPIYGKGEADAMVRLAFYAFFGWDTTDFILRADREASDFMISKFDSLIERLATEQPIQYILGIADFYGMVFRVKPGVLIPRPETAGLVDWIVDLNRDRKDLDVLDIGCGSGCISIPLALNLPFAVVTGIDINPVATEITGINADRLHAKVKALQQDIMKWMPDSGSFDIIVSNPPYITVSEKKDMRKNVLDFEPHDALFVPDANPLIFYKRIIDVARESLRDGGQLFFEINPLFASDILNLLNRSGWNEISLRKDYLGKDRFIRAVYEADRH